MLDTGLLLSGAAAVTAMWLAARWLVGRPSDALDRLLVPAMVGILAGRAAALVLDDPTSLRSLRAFLVIRGGVELWPGLAAAVAAAAIAARRAAEPVLDTLATLAPIALVGYATFEATCLMREGCYGPNTALGLRPDGLPEPMLPLGVIVGAVLVTVAVVLARGNLRPGLVVVGTVFALGATRSIAAVWLPRIGEELTRPHRESLAVTGLAAALLIADHLTRRRTLP